jgi:hypothetical protein
MPGRYVPVRRVRNHGDNMMQNLPCGGCRQGDPQRDGGYDVRTQCRLCWQWLNNPEYRSFFSKPTEPPSSSQAPKPCLHYERADTVPAARLIELNLNTTRDYRTCEHSAQPLGPIVCSCTGCGPACPGYTVGDQS